MTERLYTKYDAVRNFVNRGRLPKTREDTLAIAEVFHNHDNSKLTTQAAEYASEINHLTAEELNWKERREALRSHKDHCREVLRRLIEPNLTKIDHKQLKRLKSGSDSEEEEVKRLSKKKSKNRRR